MTVTLRNTHKPRQISLLFYKHGTATKLESQRANCAQATYRMRSDSIDPGTRLLYDATRRVCQCSNKCQFFDEGMCLCTVNINSAVPSVLSGFKNSMLTLNATILASLISLVCSYENLFHSIPDDEASCQLHIITTQSVAYNINAVFLSEFPLSHLQATTWKMKYSGTGALVNH